MEVTPLRFIGKKLREKLMQQNTQIAASDAEIEQAI